MLPEACVLGKTSAWLLDNEWKSDRFGASETVTLHDLVAEYQERHRVVTDCMVLGELPTGVVQGSSPHQSAPFAINMECVGLHFLLLFIAVVSALLPVNEDHRSQVPGQRWWRRMAVGLRRRTRFAYPATEGLPA